MPDLRDTMLFTGNKSVPLSALPPEAWTYVSGGDADSSKVKTVFETVPWLFRGIHLRSQALQDLPFSLYRGDEVIDSSEDWRNIVGWLPDIFELMYLTEGSLTIHGRAFAFLERTSIGLRSIRWIDPTSVRPLWDPFKGLTGFRRPVNNVPKDFDVEDFGYIKYPNFFSETARGRSPAEAALAAAGVLMSIDQFASTFFDRGAIKATLLTVEGEPQKAERDRLLNWWRRIASGIKNAFSTDVVSATVKPVIIGEGLSELSDKELTKERREDISTALSIPQSILFSSGVNNRSVSEQDDLNFYTKHVIPEARMIERKWNAQIFQPQGYRLKFEPQNMALFQEDEAERASSLSALTLAGMDLDIALRVLGYDLNPEDQARIETRVEEKAQAREQLRNRLESGPSPAPPPSPPPGETPVPPGRRMMLEDLQKWERKALRHFGEGRKASASFVSDTIPPNIAVAIEAQLDVAQSEAEIRAIFDPSWVGYP